MKFKPTLDSEWIEWPYWRGPTREECAKVEPGMPLFWSLDEFGTKERIYALKWDDGSGWCSGPGFSYEWDTVECQPKEPVHFVMDSPAGGVNGGYYVIYSDEGRPCARVPVRWINGAWRHFSAEPLPEPDQ